MSNCFKVGDRVKWAPDIAVSVWRGTVTAIEGNYCVCDDRGRISAGLLVLAEDGEMVTVDEWKPGVGIVTKEWVHDERVAVDPDETVWQAFHASDEECARLRAENDALVDVIAMQAELIQPAGPAREQDATLQRLLDYYLLDLCGTSDWRAGDTKLGVLVNHIRRFYR